MIKLVVFDWNGTILSDTMACMDSDNHLIKFFGGKPVDLKTYRDTVIIPSNSFYARHGCRMDIIAKQSNRLGQFHSFYEERAKKCRTRKGAKEILEWLHSN